MIWIDVICEYYYIDAGQPVAVFFFMCMERSVFSLSVHVHVHSALYKWPPMAVNGAH